MKPRERHIVRYEVAAARAGPAASQGAGSVEEIAGSATAAPAVDQAGCERSRVRVRRFPSADEVRPDAYTVIVGSKDQLRWFEHAELSARRVLAMATALLG